MCNEMHFTIFLVFFVECGKFAHTRQLVQRQFKNRKKISHETSTKTNARLFFLSTTRILGHKELSRRYKYS
jgi:hypothetical protein